MSPLFSYNLQREFEKEKQEQERITREAIYIYGPSVQNSASRTLLNRYLECIYQDPNRGYKGINLQALSTVQNNPISVTVMHSENEIATLPMFPVSYDTEKIRGSNLRINSFFHFDKDFIPKAILQEMKRRQMVVFSQELEHMSPEEAVRRYDNKLKEDSYTYILAGDGRLIVYLGLGNRGIYQRQLLFDENGYNKCIYPHIIYSEENIGSIGKVIEYLHTEE